MIQSSNGDGVALTDAFLSDLRAYSADGQPSDDLTLKVIRRPNS